VFAGSLALLAHIGIGVRGSESGEAGMPGLRMITDHTGRGEFF
jgi:hypothetical protein